MNIFVKIINSVRSFLVEPSERAKTIIDISKWQCTADDSKLFDFDVYETSDGIGIIVKAAQGVYIDKRYLYYLSEIIPREIFFGTYFFADMKYTAKASAAYWANLINNLPPDKYKSSKEITRHWLDVENSGFKGFTKVQGRTWVRAFLAEMDSLCPGIKIGIYTSYYGWKDNIAWMPEAAERDMWVAHYGVTNPSVPQEWFYAGKTWRIHQKCDSCTRCGSCGKKYGAASASIDSNDFNGTMAEYIEWHINNGEDQMSSQEYLELKGDIAALTQTVNDLADLVALHTHDGGEPPISYTDEYIVTADPTLVMRDAPSGVKIVSVPFGATVFVKPDSGVADASGRGYWVNAKWGNYIGWLADWYLKKKQ